jgi:MerR family transcriptional regulator, light-induced transcriptional regulator
MTEDAPIYNLKAVVQETGLNPETLRAWERRYGLPKPRRTQGGHRLYTKRDIHLIKWLMTRQEEGLSISRAVELWRKVEEGGENPLLVEAGREPAAIYELNTLNELRRGWVESCLIFDEESAERIISQAFAIASLEAVCFEVLGRGLAEIGNLWYQGEATVQQEHFATSLAMRRLYALLTASPPPTRSGVLLAACPPGEEHEFSLLLMTFLLRRHGWEVVHLGANVPFLRLEETLQATKPVLVIALAQTFPAVVSLREMGDFVNRYDTPLAFGGGAFIDLPSLRERISGFYLGEDMPAIPRKVERILRGKESAGQGEAVSEDYQRTLEAFREVRPLVDFSVTRELDEESPLSDQFDQANIYLRQSLEAALALGDIRLLENSLDWISGLLSNNTEPAETLERHLSAYSAAIDQHLNSQGRIITDWLNQYSARMN